jgi:hypothetical protein
MNLYSSTQKTNVSEAMARNQTRISVDFSDKLSSTNEITRNNNKRYLHTSFENNNKKFKNENVNPICASSKLSDFTKQALLTTIPVVVAGATQVIRDQIKYEHQNRSQQAQYEYQNRLQQAQHRHEMQREIMKHQLNKLNSTKSTIPPPATKSITK